MIKILLLFCIFILTINAQTINFLEEKYVELINDTIIKKGTLSFETNQISLNYKGSDKTLVYKNDLLLIKTKKDIQKIDSKNQFALKIVFLIIEAINKNDFKTLKRYFIVEESNTQITLTPNGNLKNYISDIKFKKNKKLEYLTINMKNGNKTTIREIND